MAWKFSFKVIKHNLQWHRNRSDGCTTGWVWPFCSLQFLGSHFSWKPRIVFETKPLFLSFFDWDEVVVGWIHSVKECVFQIIMTLLIFCRSMGCEGEWTSPQNLVLNFHLLKSQVLCFYDLNNRKLNFCLTQFLEIFSF